MYSALHEDRVSLCVDANDFQILNGYVFDAVLTCEVFVLEHAGRRAVRAHGTGLSVNGADAVGFFQTVLVPSLDDARVTVTFRNAACVYFIARCEDVRFHRVSDVVTFYAVDTDFFQNLAGRNARFFELTEFGLVEVVFFFGQKPEFQRNVTVRFYRFDLHYGAGTCFHNRYRDHFPVFRKQLGHAHFAADDCFTTHCKVHSFSFFIYRQYLL